MYGYFGTMSIKMLYAYRSALRGHYIYISIVLASLNSLVYVRLSDPTAEVLQESLHHW